MTKFSELHLDTTLSVAVIATGLAIAWFGGAVEAAGPAAARATDQVTISQADGRYRMTVTAQRPRDFVPATIQASASGRIASRQAAART